LTEWLEYFSDTVLKALTYSRHFVLLIIEKAKLFDRLRNELNPRQEKLLHRLFRAGPDGWKGGLSAQNYISITRATRPTATRDLADLVKKGALSKTGERRHTRYQLAALSTLT
jgi:Fic family protein